MKKFIFGKIFAMMAAGVAVFALAFAGCDDLSGTLRRALEIPKKAEVTGAGELAGAFTDPTVKVIEIKDDIDGAKLEKIIVPAGDKTIYIPGGKETSLGSLELSAGSHIKIMNADEGGTAKSVSAALVMSGQNYEGWATLVIWDNFVIPDGATFDLIGSTRLVFRKAVVDGKLAAEIEDSILGAGEEKPEITGNGKVYTSKEADEKSPALAAGGIKGSEGHAAPPVPPLPPAGPLPPIKFYNTDYASGTAFDTEGWTGAGADDEAWTLTAGEYGTVYFAVNKAEGQTVTATGADAELVTVYDSGSVEGAVIGSGGEAEAIEAGVTRTVFAVKTGDLLFEGGTRTFALKEGERSIPVTVNVTPNLTGAAVFLVEREGDREFLTRRDTGTETVSYTDLSDMTDTTGPANPAPFNGSTALIDALAWVDYNAVGSDEWLIRADNAENLIPRTLLGSGHKDAAANIKIRLRGHDGTEHIIKHNQTDASSKGNNFYGKNTNHTNYGRGSNIGVGMISVIGTSSSNGETVPTLTLQLEKGITLMGTGNTKAKASTSGVYWHAAMVGLGGNSRLVMKAGSKITGHNPYSVSDRRWSVIQRTKYVTNVSSSLQAVVIEAGAEISGNKLTGFDSNTPSGAKPVIINIDISPGNNNVFISKGAVIRDNVASGDDYVNYAYVNGYYDIKSDGNRETDIVIKNDK
jgi:hypothetical protein